MSSGEVGLALLWKPLAGVFGGFLALILGLVGYIWKKQDTRINKVEKSQSSQQYDMLTKYWTKEETKDVITSAMEPLVREQRISTEVNRDLVKELKNLQAVLNKTSERIAVMESHGK